MKKSLFSVLLTVIVLYLAICVYFFFIQNSILFNPSPLPDDHTYSYTFEFEERWFQGTDEDARIHAILAKADSGKGLVIFFHGNGGNTDTEPQKFDLFLEQGYDVLYPDYRTYGKTKGRMWNEEDLVGDMKLVYQAMLAEYDEESIIVLGYSLGSGIAALVAAENDPRKVVIWTPYYSMIDMKNADYSFLPSFLVRFPLRTDLALPKIDEPITIFYAGEDTRLPIERGMKLNQFLDENDEYVILEGQKHNGVFNNPVLREKMAEILSR
ncbi:MAG: alpha/beta hydrolase [Balneolales bacterium]|nr:alpha/beta hydrolase [Balneolales bacterium]